MTPTNDIRGEPVEDIAPGVGPGQGHFPHGRLTNSIIGASFVVHNVLGAGFLESNYANALAIELRLQGARAIDPAHRAQVLNYLRASGLEVGLIINFSTSVQFKRVVATAGSRKSSNSNGKT
jgi:hypothetical protein